MKRILPFLALLLCVAVVQAQNPFEKFGYTPKMGTLSKGKYIEHFDTDSIVQIGSVLFNPFTKKITGIVETETVYSEATLQPEIVSRWMSPDPLSDEFPEWSPYVFTNNNPIRYVDPEGLAPFDVIAKDKQSQENIRNQLSQSDRQYVTFDKNGKLNAERLNQANSGSGNLRNLKVLANSENIFTFSSSKTAETLNSEGNISTASMEKSEYGHLKGLTAVPEEMRNSKSTAISVDQNVNIFVSSELGGTEAAKTTAHETVHAVLFEFKSKGLKVNPEHKYELTGQAKDGAFIFSETNGLLKMEIDSRVKEVINNNQ